MIYDKSKFQIFYAISLVILLLFHLPNSVSPAFFLLYQTPNAWGPCPSLCTRCVSAGIILFSFITSVNLLGHYCVTEVELIILGA